MTTKPIPRGDLEVALGRRFRSVRRASGVRQIDVAKRLGLSINTVRWHEAGARLLRVDELMRAAEIIGCDPVNLISLGPERPGANNDNTNVIS